MTDAAFLEHLESIAPDWESRIKNGDKALVEYVKRLLTDKMVQSGALPSRAKKLPPDWKTDSDKRKDRTAPPTKEKLSLQEAVNKVSVRSGGVSACGVPAHRGSQMSSTAWPRLRRRWPGRWPVPVARHPARDRCTRCQPYVWQVR